MKILFTALGGSVAPHLRAGKLKVIAVTEKRRPPLLKDIPTLAELGYAGVEVDAWYGVLAPAGTPYTLGTGIINVDASRIIKGHADYDLPEVAWLVLSAAGLVRDHSAPAP